MKLRNLSLLILLLLGIVFLLESISHMNRIFEYATYISIILVPLILIGYAAMTKKYKGEYIVLSLLLAVIGSFFILYAHYFYQVTPLEKGIPKGTTGSDITIEQLLFSIVVRINLVATIVYGMYFSVPAFRKK